jgi:hypothetical protein
VEEPSEDLQKEAEADKADEPKAEAKATPKKDDGGGEKQKMSQEQVAALSNELEDLEMATLGALSSLGPATANVLRGGEAPTSALDAAAASSAGVSAGGPGGLNLGNSGGAIRPGESGGSLASIGSTGKTGGSDGSGTATTVSGPKGNAAVGGAAVAGGSVSNASSVVARMRAGFRACYQRALSTNPDAQGRISLKIKVGPSGQVTGVAAAKSGNLPQSVVDCVKGRARAATFAAPDGGSAVVSVPVTFVHQ